MEENRINNVLDNIDENTKMLLEIVMCLGEVKSKLCGERPICEKVKESCDVTEEHRNTLGYKVGTQAGIITDIMEEARRIHEKV